MVIPLTVVDRSRLLPADLIRRLRQRTQELAHSFDGVEECRLSVDGPGRHQLAGRVRVRLYLSVSGTQNAVSHQSGEDLSLALRSAFDAADRRLKAHSRFARPAGRKPARGPKREAK